MPFSGQKNTPTVYIFSSIAEDISSVSSIKASAVGFPDRKPYGLSFSKLNLSMYLSNILLSNFSNIFQNCDNKDTGL